MATILIAGGTGLIGTRLSELLSIEGHQVILLSRTQDLNASYPAYEWNLHDQVISKKAVLQSDYIINLAGAGIADKPWTDGRKKIIIESRTKSNELLLKALQSTGHRPKAYIASTAIGIYGDRGETLVNEDSGPGSKGFLVESCQAWEKSVLPFESLEIRTVAIRVGLVLSGKGGALSKMTMSVPMGLAPYFGSGKQWYSWIHIDDICRMFIHAIEDEEMRGFYNGVAPSPVRNKTMMKSIAKVMNKKAMVIPTPSFALRIAMGELADVVLTGAKVSAEKIEQKGFQFLYPQLEDALKHLLKK